MNAPMSSGKFTGLYDLARATLLCLLLIYGASSEVVTGAQSPDTLLPIDAQPLSQQANSDEDHVSLLAPDGSGVMDRSWLTLEDQHPDSSTLTIPQLFEVAGQPLTWPQRGVIWPYYELMNRALEQDLDVIVQSASDCLFNEPASENTHAFCVFVLTHLNPDGVDDIFLSAFPDLNRLGQHQVALYAYEYSKPAFAQSFAQMLNELSAWDETDRRPLIAAAFAMDNYNSLLHMAVIDYHDRFRDSIANYPYSVGLPAFPYSDAGRLSIDNAPKVFEEAIRIGNSMQKLTERGMTAAEHQWLQDYHSALEDVERIDLPRRTRGLRELIDELNQRFSSQQFTLGSSLADDSDPVVIIGGQQLSATEILSILCNEYDLNPGFGSFPDAWHIGNHWPAHDAILVENPCAAHGPFLARLEAQSRPGRGIMLRIYFSTDRTLLPVIQHSFDWQHVFSDDGKLIALPARSDKWMGVVTLPTSIEDIDEFPAFSIRGTAGVMVPEIIHHLDQLVLPGMTEFRMSHELFQLRYKEDAEAVHINWGIPTACCPAAPRLPTRNSGTVTIYNAQEQIIRQIYAVPLLSNDTTELNSTAYLSKSSLAFQRPARLEWAISPLMNRYMFGLEFRNVRLVRAPALNTRQ